MNDYIGANNMRDQILFKSNIPVAVVAVEEEV